MAKKLLRKEFIRMAALGGAGLYLSACRSPKAEPVTLSSKPVTSTVFKPFKATNNDVVFYSKGDAVYDELRKGYNKRIDKFPAVIALCKTTLGVSEALEQARKSSLEVAVKSGGHCMEGFSVNDGGMVINLSTINEISGLTDGLVKVGPGTRLMQMYDTLLPQKRIVPAGSCGMVGIGGLALGGGYGFFSRQYGLTCDHLVELTMVDGKGNVHVAKKDDELLWACRGGGSGNFGVVTSMTFRTHPSPDQFRTHRFRAFNNDTAKAVKILEKWFAINANLPLTCFSAFVLSGKTVYILLTNFGEHTSEIQVVVDAFTALTDKASNWQPVEIAKALKEYYGSLVPVNFRNSCAGLYAGFDEISNVIPTVMEKVMETPGMIYQVNTMGGKVTDKDFERISAYPHRSKIFVSELQTYWQQTGENKKLAQAFSDVQSMFVSNGITAQYCNYPYLGFDNWQRAYYGSNYQRLQAVKNLYDPDNFIRHQQSVRNK